MHGFGKWVINLGELGRSDRRRLGNSERTKLEQKTPTPSFFQPLQRKRKVAETREKQRERERGGGGRGIETFCCCYVSRMNQRDAEGKRY